MTSKFTGAANIPLLLLQFPQIVLNARNLLSGNKCRPFCLSLAGRRSVSLEKNDLFCLNYHRDWNWLL